MNETKYIILGVCDGKRFSKNFPSEAGIDFIYIEISKIFEFHNKEWFMKANSDCIEYKKIIVSRIKEKKNKLKGKTKFDKIRAFYFRSMHII